MRGSSEFESKLRSGGAMSGAAAAIAGNGSLIGSTGVGTGGNTTGTGRTRMTRASAAAAAAAAAAAGGEQGGSSTQNITNNISNSHKPRTPPRGGSRGGGGGGGQAMGKLSVGLGPDPELLRRALDDSVGEVELGSATTPAPSPSRKRQRIYGDRYVWLRVGVWKGMIGGIDNKLMEWIDLYRIEMGWIYRRVIAYYMRRGRLQHQQSQRKRLPVGSYSIRRVCMKWISSPPLQASVNY